MLVACISFLLAYLTFQYIEKPIRYGKINKNLSSILLCIVIFCCGIFGYIVYKNNGFPKRMFDRGLYEEYFQDTPPMRKYARTHNIFKLYRVECDFYNVDKYLNGEPTDLPRTSIDPSCYNHSNNKSIFIWGDSHAQALYPGLKSTLPKDVSILQVASSGCHPNVTPNVGNDPNDEKPYCITSNNFALQVIKNEKPNIVIMAQYMNHNINRTREIVSKLKEFGIRHIIVIGPAPSWEPALYKVIASKYWLNTPSRISTNLNNSVLNEEKLMQEGLKHSDKFQYVSLINFFCNQDGCLAYLNNDKKNGITTFDNGHLTPVASKYLAESLLVPLIMKDLDDN